MPNSNNTVVNGWTEWSKHVLLELERLNDGLETLKKDNAEEHKHIREAISLTHTEIAILKVKSGLWGAAAGAIPAIVVILWHLYTIAQVQ